MSNLNVLDLLKGLVIKGFMKSTYGNVIALKLLFFNQCWCILIFHLKLCLGHLPNLSIDDLRWVVMLTIQ